MTTDAMGFVVAAGATVVVLGASAYRFRSWLGSFLSPDEWRIYLKILAIVVCAVLLLVADVAADASGEGFIYGNF
ncbi:MAG: hypothetical protein HOW73_13750 [Polyangiaceae bacterium]|nr:hypothetical protein [Polyangiaceae bacterium]